MLILEKNQDIEIKLASDENRVLISFSPNRLTEEIEVFAITLESAQAMVDALTSMLMTAGK